MPTATTYSRAALALILDHLGRARETLDAALGDTNKNPAALHAMEAAFARLRGTTLFHDTDYARDYLTFGASSSEPVGLGLQGARLVADAASAYVFPSLPSVENPIWTPEYWGPPTTEGWGAWQYGPWKGWTDASPQSWEPSSGTPANDAASIRAGLLYPHRYDPSAPAATTAERYLRVPLFASARYLSLYASAGDLTTGDTLEVTLLAEDLAGVRVFDKDNAPQDIRVCYFTQLVQEGGNPATWEGISLPPDRTLPAPAAFQITYDADAAVWKLRLNVPAGLTVPQGSWWHVVLYWGSGDSYAHDLTSGTSYVLGTLVVVDDTDVLKWPRKNFFDKRLPDVLRVKHDRFEEYVNDATPRLLARGRTHLELYDGQFTAPTDPERYALPTVLPAAPNLSDTNTVEGYVSLTSPLGPSLLAQPFLIAVHTSAGYFDGSLTSAALVPGPELAPEFWPARWEDSPYFPTCPEDHVEVARFVAVAAPQNTLGVARSRRFDVGVGSTPYDYGYPRAAYTLNEGAVAWLRQVVPSHAVYPLGDKNLSALLLPRFLSALNRLRQLAIGDPFADAAYLLAVPAVGTPLSLVPTRSSVASTEPSRIFRGLLAQPYLDRLKTTDPDEGAGIPMSAEARGVIYDLAGKEQPVDLMRFRADRLERTGESLRVPSVLELYMEPSDQCSAIAADSSGNRLGLDYTLRLTLEDADENVLHKDWYVMASRYYLTDEEYQRRVTAGLPLTGYFTKSLLQNIEQFRLQGYAALVPDLAMGKSARLLTRMVAPPDATKVTEEQFRKNLENQGYTQAQIDEAVLEYLEDGGEFYVEDTHQYPNLFTGLRSVALSYATYTFDSVLYWDRDTLPTAPQTDEERDALRSDSFAVAGGTQLVPGPLEGSFYTSDALVAGYYPADSDLTVPDNITIVDDDRKEQRPAVAVKIRKTADTTVAEMIFEAKLTAACDNPDATLTVTLRADSGEGEPGAVLVTAPTLPYGDLDTDYTEYRAALPYTLRANTDYWVVWEKSAVVSGATLVLHAVSGAASGSLKHLRVMPDGVDGGGWTAAAGAVYCGFFAPAPVVCGAFNREDWQISQMLPGPNRLREKSPIYRVEGWTSFTSEPFSAPKELWLYPRAVKGDDGDWHWVAPSRDIWVWPRVVVNGKVVESAQPIKLAKDVAAGPVKLWPDPVEALAYLGVAKTEPDISTASHGAPSGDRLILRSVV